MLWSSSMVIINRGLQERSLCIAHIFEVLTKWPGAQPLIYELMTERKNQRRNEYGYQGLRTPAGTTPGSTPNPEQSTHDYPPGANCLIFNVRPPTNRGCLAFFKGTKMAVCAGRAEEKDVLKSPSGLSQKRHQTLTVNT